MPEIGVGLVGTGRHGRRYVKHLLEDFPEHRLAGIARRNFDVGAEQARAWGCEPFARFEELIASPAVDAVIVVVPPTLHERVVSAAVEAGKPVLLEKPAAPTLCEGRRLLGLSRERAVPVMVAQTLRYNGVVNAIRAARDAIGPLHAVRLSQRFEPSRPGWIDDPMVAGGGVMLHTGVHSFDMLRYLTGAEPERVSCETGVVGTAQTEDNFVASVRCSKGILASVAGSRATGSRSGPIELAGEGGQLIGDHVLNTAVLVRRGEVQPLDVPPAIPTVKAVLGEFLAALSQSRTMPIPLEEGLRAVAAIRACYEAAERRCAVDVERID